MFPSTYYTEISASQEQLLASCGEKCLYMQYKGCALSDPTAKHYKELYNTYISDYGESRVFEGCPIESTSGYYHISEWLTDVSLSETKLDLLSMPVLQSIAYKEMLNDRALDQEKRQQERLAGK